ncbi:hypothetical protein K2173_014901 [Erythroxylum novogranatense]|uniref:Uncharacterized protein n=1 Tax=Erythroxylum novogranatense TaxID=1862640 RepID=A0AAV8TIG4_9ROSI|nr:hypothetical protein K2173_014901 [Erythroxylum novogranatense]
MAAASPCDELLKQPSFGEGRGHCSLEVVPLLLEKTPLSVEENCPFLSHIDQDVYSISLLAGGGNNGRQCASQVAVLGFVELPPPPKTKICIDPRSNCQNFVNLQMENAEAYSPCVVDIELDLESSGKTKLDDETAGSIKSGGLLTGMLIRQASQKIFYSFMQLFTNQSSTLMKLISRDKSFTERIQDTPNNRLRRYKRSASFDSRKIVLLFSILSSLGTLILIYLTLRVRQSVEVFVNV